MAGSAGKNLRVKVSTTAGGAGAYTVVADISSATMNRDGHMLDITAFSNTDVTRILGLRDSSYDLKGFYNSADTLGQNVIDTANTNGTELWIQFLPNGTTGWKQQVMVPKFSPSAAVSGVIDLNVQLVGTGPITVV